MQPSAATPPVETQDPPVPAEKAFVRRKASFPVQCVAGAFVYGIATPVVWTLERLGLVERVLGSFSAKIRENLHKNNPFRGYEPGPQDVFVMTMPKSGTNWMMQVAHQLIWHGQAEYEHIHDEIPWPDIQVMPSFMRGYAIPLPQANHWKRSPEKKRVIKTHFDWELLPYSSEARYIAVIRDPKDVFVSSYFFIRDSVYGPAMPSVDTWYRTFVSGRSLMGSSWPSNTAGYWAQRSRPNVLVLSFKSMKRDLAATVRTVANFLDIHVGEDVRQKVVDLSSFQHMKSIDHKFNMGKIVAGRPAGAMIRKGTQGGSSELLSLERQKEIDAYCIAELKRLGCDFPYDEFCDRA